MNTLLPERPETRNSEVLADFVAYCEAHPQERFWQALRNWSGFKFIFASDTVPQLPFLRDTYYWGNRNGPG